ncbi:MAG: hypothetical protein Q7S71_00540 [Candidatus Nitrotoga sp.]|nr:hypothetical protein [Candidatus Nitrotoga sp.]
MRRVNCPTCGVKVEEVPWGTGKHTLCNAYMLHLARWVQKLSWKETAESFHTSWDKREWSPICDSGLPDRGWLHQIALDWEGTNNGKLREILHPDRRGTGGENRDGACSKKQKT